ncbi:MAG TPA: endonuclease/exonuclease/phosphatase family protein [Pirellulales bacterium]|jgi:endonuclease/exonuclease/phosphatase (EEP) superfamily protein YafD
MPFSLFKQTDPRDFAIPKLLTAQFCRAVLATAAVSYLVGLALLWGFLRAAGDRWWFATVLLYAPRWLYGVPLIVLIPLAAWANRRALLPLLAAIAIFILPVMGFRVPLARNSEADKPRLRVITCNMQGGKAARVALAEFAVNEQADIVALQECDSDVRIPWPETWHEIREGALVVASRYPLRDSDHSVRAHPQSQWPPSNALRCVVEAPSGDIGFCCVHLLTPRSGLERVLDQRTIVAPGRSRMLSELIQCRRWESEELKQWITDFNRPTIIAGDFNMPVDSTIYLDIWSSFTNAFDVAGFGFGTTKITTKRGWSYGARIDQILYGNTFFGCRKCWVGPDVGSDHFPLVADIVARKPSDMIPPQVD